jgi:glucosyl-3-phosphoglycerate synthase
VALEDDALAHSRPVSVTVQRASNVDVIIPARDEETTVTDVVAGIRAALPVSRIIVVDNGSTDRTARRAAIAGAEVFSCPEPGLGRAMCLGLAQSRSSRILRTDADIDALDFGRLGQLLDSEADLARGVFESPYDDFPVTRLVVEPLLGLVFPTLTIPPLPISGTYLLRRAAFAGLALPTDWAFDLAVVLFALRERLAIENVDIGLLGDRRRPLSHYVQMASDIMRYTLQCGSPKADT